MPSRRPLPPVAFRASFGWHLRLLLSIVFGVVIVAFVALLLVAGARRSFWMLLLFLPLLVAGFAGLVLVLTSAAAAWEALATRWTLSLEGMERHGPGAVRIAWEDVRAVEQAAELEHPSGRGGHRQSQYANRRLRFLGPDGAPLLEFDPRPYGRRVQELMLAYALLSGADIELLPDRIEDRREDRKARPPRPLRPLAEIAEAALERVAPRTAA